MHNLLSKLLVKRNLARDQLSEDEKQDFDRWERILNSEITVDTISKFCESQIAAIELQWKNFDNDPRKNERLIIAHSVYSTLKQCITAPEVERASLEEYLTKLIQ